ncbi:hypothetical protein BRN25_11040, partial [Xanthomonas oryzae pv. oryzae]
MRLPSSQPPSWRPDLTHAHKDSHAPCPSLLQLHAGRPGPGRGRQRGPARTRHGAVSPARCQR